MYYCFRCLRGDFGREALDATATGERFSEMLASPQTMAFWMIVAVVISFGICILGVQKGVERITKVMMIALLGLILVLAVHSVRLPGAAEGIRFYLIPDFKKMRETGIGDVVFGAMSQAFFTLSLGIGAMAIFGSYLHKDRSLTGEAMNIGILDTFVALMAGLIIIPACFAFGIEPGAGPSQADGSGDSYSSCSCPLRRCLRLLQCLKILFLLPLTCLGLQEKKRWQ